MKPRVDVCVWELFVSHICMFYWILFVCAWLRQQSGLSPKWAQVRQKLVDQSGDDWRFASQKGENASGKCQHVFFYGFSKTAQWSWRCRSLAFSNILDFSCKTHISFGLILPAQFDEKKPQKSETGVWLASINLWIIVEFGIQASSSLLRADEVGIPPNLS